MIDFYRPDGTPVPVVRGDPRQLNDATFHAGTSSGSEYEHIDSHNRLHFYVSNERMRAAAGAAALAFLYTAFLLAGCDGGGGGTPSGAGDLPGPVPEGTVFSKPPRWALDAPPFAAELLDGTPVRSADL